MTDPLLGKQKKNAWSHLTAPFHPYLDGLAGLRIRQKSEQLTPDDHEALIIDLFFFAKNNVLR